MRFARVRSGTGGSRWSVVGAAAALALGAGVACGSSGSAEPPAAGPGADAGADGSGSGSVDAGADGAGPAPRACDRSGPPIDVSAVEEAPLSLVADAARIYWISADGVKFRVRAATKTDPAANVSTVLETTDEVGAMTLVGGRLVLSSRGASGQVFTLDPATGERKRLAGAPAGLELDAFGVAADATTAFVVAHETSSLSEVLLQVPLTGGKLTELARIKLPFDQTLKGATADATHVYWALSSGLVMRAAKGAPGAVETVVDDRDGLSAFVVTDSEIVFASGSMTTPIVRTPKAGGPKTTIVEHTGARYGLTVVGRDVVYATANDDLRRVSLGGGDDKQIAASGVRSCGSILLDGAEVFFANTATAKAGGSVRAVCLPR